MQIRLKFAGQKSALKTKDLCKAQKEEDTIGRKWNREEIEKGIYGESNVFSFICIFYLTFNTKSVYQGVYMVNKK